MCETTFVAHPDLVHFFILARHHAFDHDTAVCARLAPGVVCDVAAHRALAADRSRRHQLPRSSAETEIGRRQRAHGADVGGVAGEYRVHARLGQRDDLHGSAALLEPKHRVPCDLILETDAPGALDAALAVEPDQFSEWILLGEVLLLIVEEAALSRAVGKC